MEKEERILALEKALLEYVKKYGFNDAAREYFVTGSAELSADQRQMN